MIAYGCPYSIMNFAATIKRMIKNGVYDPNRGYTYTFEGIKLEERLVEEDGKLICLASKTLMQLVALSYISTIDFNLEECNIFLKNNRLIIPEILYRYYDLDSPTFENNFYNENYPENEIRFFINEVYRPLMNKFNGNINFMEKFYIDELIKCNDKLFCSINPRGEYIFTQNKEETKYEKLLREREIELTRQVGRRLKPNLHYDDFYLSLFNNLSVPSRHLCNLKAPYSDKDQDNLYGNFSPITDFAISNGANKNNGGMYFTQDEQRDSDNVSYYCGRPMLNLTRKSLQKWCFENISVGSQCLAKYDFNSRERRDGLTISVDQSNLCTIRPIIIDATYIFNNYDWFKEKLEKYQRTNMFELPVIEFGEYPHYVPNGYIIDQLDYKCNKQELKILPYPFIHPNCSDQKLQEYPIYVYQDKKYIKKEIFQDCIIKGKQYNKGDMCWFEYAPVKWDFTTFREEWEDYLFHFYENDDKYFRVFGLMAREQLDAGIKYDKHYIYFPYSNLYNYLNNVMQKNMFWNMTLDNPEVQKRLILEK